MTRSDDSDNSDSETEEDGIDASRFVVSADQMREGDFYTLDDVTDALDDG